MLDEEEAESDEHLQLELTTTDSGSISLAISFVPREQPRVTRTHSCEPDLKPLPQGFAFLHAVDLVDLPPDEAPPSASPIDSHAQPDDHPTVQIPEPEYAPTDAEPPSRATALGTNVPWTRDADGNFISPTNDPPKTVMHYRLNDCVTYPGVIRSWEQAIRLAKSRRRKLLPPCPHNRERNRRKLSKANPEYIGSRVGASVGLYFQALQSLSLLFVAVSIFHLPYLAAAFAAENKAESFGDETFAKLSATTLGALLPPNATLLNISQKDMLQAVSVFDILAIVTMLFGVTKLTKRQEKALESFDERVLSLTDYTAMVSIPINELASPGLANEIADFFELYRTYEGNDPLSVERVCLGTMCNELIQMFARRTRQLRQKRRNHALENATRGELGERAKRWYKRRADNTSDAIVREWASITEEFRFTTAFVTFSTTEDKSIALNEFPNTDVSFTYTFLYKRNRKFRPPGVELRPHHARNIEGGRPLDWGDGFKVTVQRASESSNVIWENLEYTRTARCLATAGVSTIVTFMLLVSFALLVGSSVLDRQLVPSISAKSSLKEGQLECYKLVGYNASLSEKTDISIEALEYMKSEKFGPFKGSECRDFMELSTYVPEDANCLESKGVEQNFQPGVPAEEQEDLVTRQCRCEATFCYQIYCDNLGFRASRDDESIGSEREESARSYCSDYYRIAVQRKVLLVLSSIVAVAVNMGLRYAVSWLASKERHPTVDSVQASIASKLTAMQVINMMLISFVAYGKIPGVSDGLFGVFFGGEFADFDQGWYAGTGTNLLLIVMLQSVGPQSFELTYSAYTWYVRKTQAKNMRLQDDLDELYEPRSFRLAERAGQLNSFLFIAISLSGGMPLCSLALVIYCGFAFAVDRFLLMKDCLVPESGGKLLDSITWRTMKWAVWLHCALSMWMFGRAYLINQSSTDEANDSVGAEATKDGLRLSDRLVNRVAGPHAIFFFIITSWLIGKPLLHPFVLLLRWCNCCRPAAAAQDNPTFQEAIQRQGRLTRVSTLDPTHQQQKVPSTRRVSDTEKELPWRGPTTYSMVEDERYRHVFQIQPSDIANDKIRELMKMLPELQRHDREGFTVFDTREELKDEAEGERKEQVGEGSSPPPHLQQPKREADRGEATNHTPPHLHAWINPSPDNGER